MTCDSGDGCLTCGDIAIPLTVMDINGDDADCQDEQGRHEQVAIELIGDVKKGDRVLVHAGVAIKALEG